MNRYFVILLAAWSVFSCREHRENKNIEKFNELVSPLYDSTNRPFYHGVASGDPLADRVIIWTRVTPEMVLSKISVRWEISETENFSTILKGDTVSTGPSKDYTVKVDVKDLKPNRYYFYRFAALDKISQVGRTKTLPSGSVDSIKLAVVSCSNWEFGYFNAYDRIAEKEVDAVIHLGDYIYEYAVGKYGDKNLDRKHLPAHEAVSLDDYRTRYSQYHLDQGLRNVGMRHPFITIWDDHEVANNVYAGGAQNHQPEEGDFNTRKAAAKQAYYEWIPIRESHEHYRSFSFGSLADVIMLDERLAGRMKPADSISDPTLQNEDRSMLGAPQLGWLEDKLRNSTAIWKIIGNQVVFSDVDQSSEYPMQPKNLDSWDGYPAEKKRIAAFIKNNNVKNIIFLSGDTHASWAFEVAINPKKTYNSKTSQGSLAVELGTTSISSSNWNEYTADDTVKMGEAKFLQLNPHLKYVNLRDHGYMLLTLLPKRAKAQWFYVETLKKVSKEEHLGKTFEVEAGKPALKAF